MTATTKFRATVVHINHEKGYGFCELAPSQPDAQPRQVFFHHTACGRFFLVLPVGFEVTVTLVVPESITGPRAATVEPCVRTVRGGVR
jgi:cold shock CspA family protein